MAKPSWVSVSPQSSSGDKPVSVGVTANGGTSNRSGTITITGIISGKTITKTVTITQEWAATIRVVFSNAIVTKKASIEDNQTISKDVASASTLKVSYPYLGGSNICHYTCFKQSNGLFRFTLNDIHITVSGEGLNIDDDYWDIANAWFIPCDQSPFHLWTPVISFTYNPSTGEILIISTLYSLGGAEFNAQQGGGAIDDPICPNFDKMIKTGILGRESEGYGALGVFYRDAAPSLQKGWRLIHWYPKIIKYNTQAASRLDVYIAARSLGADTYIPEASLEQYNWEGALQGNDFTDIQLHMDTINILDGVSPTTSPMSVFYHPQMFVIVSE